MKRPEDFPQYVEAHEEDTARSTAHQKNRDRKGVLDAQVGMAGLPISQQRLLAQERADLDAAEPLLREQAETARRAFDHVSNQVGAEICKPLVREFAAEVRKIVGAIETIVQANKRLRTMRDELERAGVKTGSLPMAQFGLTGSGFWDETYPLPGYRASVAKYLEVL